MLYRTLQWIVDEYDADYRENDTVFFGLAGDVTRFMCDNYPYGYRSC